MVLEPFGLNGTELGAYCRARWLFPMQVHRWRQAVKDANAQTLLAIDELKDLENATNRTSARSSGSGFSRNSGARTGLGGGSGVLIASTNIQDYCGEDARD